MCLTTVVKINIMDICHIIRRLANEILISYTENICCYKHFSLDSSTSKFSTGRLDQVVVFGDMIFVFCMVALIELNI